MNPITSYMPIFTCLSFHWSSLIFTFSMAKGHASGLIRSFLPPFLTPQHGQRPCITRKIGYQPRPNQQMAKMAIWGNHLRRGSTSFHSVDEYEWMNEDVVRMNERILVYSSYILLTSFVVYTRRRPLTTNQWIITPSATFGCFWMCWKGVNEPELRANAWPLAMLKAWKKGE